MSLSLSRSLPFFGTMGRRCVLDGLYTIGVSVWLTRGKRKGVSKLGRNLDISLAHVVPFFGFFVQGQKERKGEGGSKELLTYIPKEIR